MDDEAFLAAPKELLRSRIRWRGKTHREYVEAKLDIAVIGRPHIKARVTLLAHRYRIPSKWDFALIRGNRRILGLDVNPGLAHRNINPTSLKSVEGTHWQSGPFLDATPDPRTLSHRQWLDEFLKRAHIRAAYAYRPPPGGEQLELLL